tara:strand:+ start:441 stop:614 length:174 start_codon:yes stop_codon:yes gene_type:complete
MKKEIKKEEQGEGGSVGTIKVLTKPKKCDMFYTYDDFMGDEERWCVNCGQTESSHKK